MRCKVVHCLTVLAALWMLSGAAWAQTWNIGVLAMRGEVTTRNHWQPLETLLNQQIAGERFHIQPLDLHQMQDAVNRGTVQFVVTNPAQFVQLNNRAALRWLASLRSTRGGKATSNVIGSAILVRRDGEIASAHDLIGKTVGAIDAQAFGGYLLGYKALIDAGLRPERDLRLRFTGFPADALVYLLREKAVQAVIVPVCLLEKMDEEGLIHKADFKVVLNHPTSIPCLSSTPLYPDWSFAALPAVSDELADRVTRVLFNAPQDAPFRWGAPASTREVETLLRDVRQHPQQRQLWLDIKSWFIQHQLVMGAAAVVLLLLTLNYIWVMLLVRRRGRLLERNNVLLRKQEQALETARQMSVLGEMTSGFAHELNQPLSAIRHYAQGCLIRLRGQDQQHPLLPALEQIDAQAQRGADTLRNLRLWASQAQGNPVMTDDWQAINIRDAVHHVWQLLRMTQQFPDVTLQTTVSANLTLTLPSVLLEQVLANLVLNAAQAGASTVWFTAQHEDDGISIQVQDNAGGIDETQLYQAFQPFMTTRKEGMGLGLVICQRLVRYAGGEISINNQQAPDGRAGVAVRLHFKPTQKGGDCGDHSSAG
ncbi:PhnD/SsuA/transferrin family substrate-binding protein [Citrobacter freundii]|uniref:tetrathionate respiration histidine kinase TtrS n=1 Tax=Citrobacter sp. wls613 TaxID=2576436 RepID=UPI0010CA8626|nr:MULTISPECIES: tetrathionate respiration histidine kinase TtrS [Citrobacter]MBA7729969.1 PhnD/SsuA/transferrin family substrate-binding protein [Citrobacter freundii]QLR73270.1 PhnD/SsuA/transferrin family substrate-binding protein [Citrobacter freundii]QLS06304.1 PhnD/SsuA/transferrin family substrate-binding protein [Citrobacter freundii]QLY69503.1 PhnD/SsuA/transferrin family substrate-binding protein [Citrobacter freundii]QLZ59806.1 PhnD/SsuA/transferrin family substrate-binding protein 